MWPDPDCVCLQRMRRAQQTSPWLCPTKVHVFYNSLAIKVQMPIATHGISSLMGNQDFLSPTSLFWPNLILSVEYTNPRAEATPFPLAAGEGLRAAAWAETVVLLMATHVSVYHLWSWKRVLSCLKQFIFLLRAKAVKRLCHRGANFPCKSDSEVSAWQPPPLTLLQSWTKGMCLQMSTCGFTWQFGMWVSGWICMYFQRQLHLIWQWHSVSLARGILWYRICRFNTGSPRRGGTWGDSSTNAGPRASQRQDLTR